MKSPRPRASALAQNCVLPLPSAVTGPEKGSGFEGEQLVKIAEADLQSACRHWPALSGLMASAAGYFPKAAGHLRRRPAGCAAAVLIYCAKGGGWCEVEGQMHPVHKGDWVALPPHTAHAYGTHQSQPWTIHWIHALGHRVPEYLRAMRIDAQHPVLRLGEHLPIVSLCHEVLHELRSADAPWNLFHAAHTLGHLLSVVIQHRHCPVENTSPTIQKVAQTITYMSEHLEAPLKMGALAALAGVSPAHFTVLFKQQTGSSPRAYLLLLRMHCAVQWLQSTDLPVKEIALRLGYQDPFHFSRQFKAFSGASPRAYRLGRA